MPTSDTFFWCTDFPFSNSLTITFTHMILAVVCACGSDYDEIEAGTVRQHSLCSNEFVWLTAGLSKEPVSKFLYACTAQAE